MARFFASLADELTDIRQPLDEEISCH